MSPNFNAPSFDDVTEATERYEEQVKKLYAAELARRNLLADPAYREALRLTQELAKANAEALSPAVKELTQIERERAAVAQRASRMLSGEYARESAAVAELRRQNESLSRQERATHLQSGQFLRDSNNAARGGYKSGRLDLRERGDLLRTGAYTRNSGRAADLESRRLTQDRAERHDNYRSGVTLQRKQTASLAGYHAGQDTLAERNQFRAAGGYANQVLQQDALRRSQQAAERAERQTELKTLYGNRLGGAAYGLERARPAMLGIGVAGGSVMAAGRSGLGDTVQMGHLQQEIALVNREIGNALVPALRELTSWVRWVRRGLEGMTARQQKMLGAGALVASGVGTAGVAGVGVLSGLATLRNLGLIGGRVAATAAPTVAAQVATQAAGTLAGNTAGNVAGSVAGGLAGGRAAGSGGKAAGAARAGGGGLGGKAAVAAGGIGGLMSAYDEYERYSSTGVTTRNVLRTAAKTVSFLPGADQAFDYADEQLGKRGMAGGTKPGQKGQGLIRTSGFESLDAGYERAASAAVLADAQNKDSGTETLEEAKKQTGLLTDLVSATQKVAGGLLERIGLR